MKSITSGTYAALLFILAMLTSLYISSNVQPQWREQALSFNIYQNDEGVRVYKYKDKELSVGATVPYEQSELSQQALDTATEKPALEEQWVVKQNPKTNKPQTQLLKLKFHFGLWSLLPAFIAIALCLLTKEPVTALLGGIVCGAFMLGRFDLIEDVLIPNLASTSAAGLLLLYLWLLGGLMGIWTRTGAAQAFAEFMTKHFVRGPRSAKLVAWSLGVVFFQGGSISTVLVGTTVRPLADKAGVSHEEMSYIVDSTGSPIASVLAFNAWPAYVQALIFVPGISFLATESDRISFFFQSIPFSFYGILAVMGTLLLSLDITHFSGKGIRDAMHRSRTTGELDAPGARPLSAKELQKSSVPEGYKPHVAEFFIPLLTLICIAVGTFIAWGTPNINWAFATALIMSGLIATFKGMAISELIEGISDGLKSVVLASVLLMLAITIGAISKEIGGAIFLVEQLGQQIPYWTLPLFLQLMTMVIAFSTGSSWGTYAIAFPLAMPLAWAVGEAQGLENPILYLSVCFATVLNGSVYGDQCSPISDTTILSSMTTGTDLMDHVKTQVVPATFAAALAALMWMGTVLIFA
jgi:Na+/H+ antiporter NhaC